jgi:parvulin-like peptidyl-prolyl isomerase
MNGKIAALLLALVSACTIVEVLDVADVETPTPMMQVQRDTTQRDTIRIPIGFEVVVDEWEEIDTTL